MNNQINNQLTSTNLLSTNLPFYPGQYIASSMNPVLYPMVYQIQYVAQNQFGNSYQYYPQQYVYPVSSAQIQGMQQQYPQQYVYPVSSAQIQGMQQQYHPQQYVYPVSSAQVQGMQQRLPSVLPTPSNIEHIPKNPINNKTKEVEEEVSKTEKKLTDTKEKVGNSDNEFTLIDLDLDVKIVESQEDKLNIAEDYFSMELSPYQMGFRHTWKRLDLLRLSIFYIHSNRQKLNAHKFSFLFPNVPHQFEAMAYHVPKKNLNKASKAQTSKATRCHCAIINKLIIKTETNELKKLNQVITVNKVKTTVSDVFNVCDIGPQLLNEVDWYIEYHLRRKMIAHLERLKDGELKPMMALEKIINSYYELSHNLMYQLRNNIPIEEIPEVKPAHYTIYQKNRTILLKDLDETINFLLGFKKAIKDYSKKFNPSYLTKFSQLNCLEIPKCA